MSNVRDLDLVAVGHALVRLATISRLMGHSSLACTAKDYLLPHEGDASPEWQFVMDVITGKNPMDEQEAGEALQAIELPPLSA